VLEAPILIIISDSHRAAICFVMNIVISILVYNMNCFILSGYYFTAPVWQAKVCFARKQGE